MLNKSEAARKATLVEDECDISKEQRHKHETGFGTVTVLFLLWYFMHSSPRQKGSLFGHVNGLPMRQFIGMASS